jgi:hypothetical protein
VGVFDIVFPMHAGQSVKLKWSLAKPKALINLAKEYALIDSRKAIWKKYNMSTTILLISWGAF